MTRHACGQTEEGVALVERAIVLNETAAYQPSLGRMLMAAGRTEAGFAALNRALALEPGQPEVLRTLGAARIRAGDMAGAEAAYRQGVAGAPQDADLLFGHAYTLAESGATQAATDQYCRLLTADPRHVQAHTNLAALLLAAGDFEGAVRHFHEATELGPDSAHALYNLGRALEARGDYTLAVDCYDRALVLEPNLAAAHNNAGTALQRQGQQAAALERFDRALAIDPDYPVARFNRSVSLLSLGRFTEGWVDYEWRFRVECLAGRIGARAFAHQRWDGGPLLGQRLLAWGEQGPGDEVMFASMVRDIISVGAEVILECDPRLVPLFARSFPAAAVVARADPPDARTADPTIGAEAPLGSLGRLLRPELASFPEQAGYLAPDPLREQACRARYATLGAGVKVGIAWRSGDSGLALADMEPRPDPARPESRQPRGPHRGGGGRGHWRARAGRALHRPDDRSVRRSRRTRRPARVPRPGDRGGRPGSPSCRRARQADARPHAPRGRLVLAGRGRPLPLVPIRPHRAPGTFGRLVGRHRRYRRGARLTGPRP